MKNKSREWAAWIIVAAIFSIMTLFSINFHKIRTSLFFRQEGSPPVVSEVKSDRLNVQIFRQQT